MIGVDFDLRTAANVDRAFSVIGRKPHCNLVTPEGEKVGEWHRRGGERVMVRYPNGAFQGLDSKDIVHVYKGGVIRERFRADNPPEGYTPITHRQLEDVDF